MDMPEGWNKLKHYFNTVESKCYSIDRGEFNSGCTPVGCLCRVEEQHALDLMKEMAEAIEIHCKYQGTIRSDLDLVLNKFKEWK